MSLSQTILPEFDHEMAGTRKTLERVPDDRLDWKPHPKSTAMRGLATHLSNIPTWASHAVNRDALDIAPPGEPPPRATPINSVEECLQTFDRNVADARAAIASATDEQLLGPWTLLSGGKPVFTLPRIAVLRSFVISHAIHHRAQLGVYLRLNDLPVPSLYGPSADESPF
jgi:uncharacterized damage-inducible protein DinB